MNSNHGLQWITFIYFPVTVFDCYEWLAICKDELLYQAMKLFLLWASFGQAIDARSWITPALAMKDTTFASARHAFGVFPPLASLLVIDSLSVVDFFNTI